MVRVMRRTFYFVGGESMWARIGNPEHVSNRLEPGQEVSGWFWDPFNVGGAIGMRNLVELR